VSYFICYRPGCPIYTGVRPIGNSPANRIYKIQFIITYCFLYLYYSSPPCPSSSRVWFNLYRFALKSGRLSSTKARGSLLLCSESIRSSSQKHDDYPGVARQFCVPTRCITTPMPFRSWSVMVVIAVIVYVACCYHICRIRILVAVSVSFLL
jgi:hypothetical protein